MYEVAILRDLLLFLISLAISLLPSEISFHFSGTDVISFVNISVSLSIELIYFDKIN